MSIIVDLDDFKDGNTSMDLLIKLKVEIPQLKVTLFTIPHYTSRHWLTVPLLDWIDFVPHGWNHHSNWECAHWSKKFMLEQMTEYRSMGFTTKGFKAPGWQISDGCYEALLQEGWWVADQAYNDVRRPKDLRTYLLDSPNKIHGHIGHLGGHNENELSLIYDKILAHKDEEFKFIREVME